MAGKELVVIGEANENNNNITEDEAKRLSQANSGDTVKMMRPLKKQPPDGYKFKKIPDYHSYIGKNNALFINIDVKYGGGTYRIPLQYPVGTRLGMRETWAEKWYHAPGNTWMGYRYKADYTPHELSNTKYQKNSFMFKWQSPVTMPYKAIRRWFIAESTQVKRVQSISTKMQLIILNSVADPNKEAQYVLPSYADSLFADYWNFLYAKPRKWKDGYVCYPWDMESFLAIHKGNAHKVREQWFWFTGTIKDGNQGYKPLTIYPNAVIEVPTGRIE